MEAAAGGPPFLGVPEINSICQFPPPK